MASNNSQSREIILNLLRKFPNTPSLTIAKLAYKEFPLLFLTLENARTMIRYYRGSYGDKKRKYKKFDMPTLVMPEGKKRMKDWAPLNIGECRALIMSDLHIPYHERKPIEQAIEAGKKEKVDTIIINGDLLDCHAISFWDTDPTERDFKEEVKTCRAFINYLRQEFPSARILWHEGNHEERWKSYMWRKAPEIWGLEDFKLEKIMNLGKHRIEYIQDKRPIKLGSLVVLHGHEYRFAISNPVNPARGLFLRAKAHAMCGHFHQSSYHTEKNANEQIIATWSTGCLCDLHAWFMPLNNWVHGFAIVDVATNSKFNVDLKVIRDGKLY